MQKNIDVIAEKANAALKRRTDAEVKLLERLDSENLEIFNDFINAMVEYENCLQ